jgi:hypothetical protein
MLKLFTVLVLIGLAQASCCVHVRHDAHRMTLQDVIERSHINRKWFYLFGEYSG